MKNSEPKKYMNMKSSHITIKGRITLLLMLTALIVSSCDRSRMDRGYDYFPDMFNSAAYKTYSEHPVLPDGKIMQEAPEGTIPVGFVPYPYDNSFESRELAGKELTNPFEVNNELIAEGKAKYEIFCVHCHGVGGKGDGNLYTSGKFLVKPATLVEGDILEKPSGEIFHVITKGWGTMAAHEVLVKPEDRWKIVMYIEEVLRKQK
ncbi:MAG: cytochrome c [Bacteroidales bacterium]